LIDLANARGGEDNISALVVQVTGVRRKGTSRLARLAAALKRHVMPHRS
jgi:serine/threonine protein phosphatase PrpC